jgi:hypothetical protein
MLEFLNLQDVGPAPHMEMTLARRLNLITGDNGLRRAAASARRALTRQRGAVATGQPGKQVILRKREFARLGTAGRWLTSEAFDLRSEGRAPQIEALLEEASQALGDEQLPAAKARKLDQRLREVLGDTDLFWIRWRFVGEQRGWLSEGPAARVPQKTQQPRPTKTPKVKAATGKAR